MLTADEIQALRDLSVQIAAPINKFIIEDISERIAATARFGQAAFDGVGQMKFTATADYMAYRAQTLGMDWKTIRKEVAKRVGISEREVDRLYETAAQRTYMDDLRRIPGDWPDFTQNPVVQNITRAYKDKATADLINVTRSMGLVDTMGRELPLKEFYSQTMDNVFYNVSFGTMDAHTAVRTACKALAEKGITSIGYQSGQKTSLEAAVRRNVMGGLGLMVEQISDYNHEQLGANGWEMSAHAMSAPDHEPYQGKQYTDAEWIRLNGKPPLPGHPANEPEVLGILKRRVGTLNCGHNAFPVVIGVNLPQYTDEQLAAMKEANKNGTTIDGKHYSLYEATQKQRGMERSIRYWKRENTAAQASSDKEYALTTQARLMNNRRRYHEFSNEAGLDTQAERLYKVGFKWDKASGISTFTALKGVKTPNGITIDNISGHFVERALKRGITSGSDIRDALKNPLKIGTIRADENGNSQRFIGEFATVNVNPDIGKLITAWQTSSKLVKKLKGGGNK